MRCMRYQPLLLFCKCGHPATAITEAGLTRDHQVVFHWWCDACGKAVFLYKGLAECWKECPRQEPLSAPITERALKTGADDSAFLCRMGIAPPDDAAF